MKYTWVNILSIALLLILAQACSEADSQESSADTSPDTQLVSVPVKVAQVVPLQEGVAIVTSGKLTAKEEIRLSFKIGGVLQSLRVEEGQSVRKGQLLAVLDPSEINAQVNQASSALEKAKRDLERAERLYADTVVTLEQVQNLETALEMAEADVQIASFNQSRATIKAPHSGIIIKRLAEEGEIVNPGTPIYMVASTNSAKVIRAGLSDVDVVQLSLGDVASISFDAYPGESFPAEVSEIPAAADPATGAFEVEFSLKPTQKRLIDGFVGKVDVFPSGQSSFLKIPMAALVEADQRRAVVYTLDEKDSTQAKRISLSNYQIHKDFIAVPASTYPNLTYVITDGAKYIKENSQLDIQQTVIQTAQAINQ
ncbi:MAG: efflux RND transporter periplasmic adaptor subunit [Bacteroidota bacterium]